MKPEDCAGCPYFDGVDICEASRVKLPIGYAVLPVLIEQVTECKRVDEEEEDEE